MKKLLLFMLPWLMMAGAAVAQNPPTAPATSYYPPTALGTPALSVTGSSGRVLLGAPPSSYPGVTIVNDGAAEIFCNAGDVTVTAGLTTGTYRWAILPGGYRAFWDGTSTYVACITSTGTATARITQSNGAPSLGMVTPNGGTPGGACGGDLAGTFPNCTVATANNATVTATGSTAARLLTVRFSQQVIVKDFCASPTLCGLAQSGTDGVFTASSTNFNAASKTFTAADVGKTVQIDGCAGVNVAPFVGTFVGFVDSHNMTLSAPCTASSGQQYLLLATISGAIGSAGSYIPGETISVTGGTFTTQAVLTVTTTQVRGTPTIAAGGTGGTTGPCVAVATTGSGLKTSWNVTVSAGGAISAIGAVISRGQYSTNPTTLAAEPVTNAQDATCLPAGAQLGLSMGIGFLHMSGSASGVYTVVPTNNAATGAGSISGATGATAVLSWQLATTYVYGTDDTAALTGAINQMISLYSTKGIKGCVYAPAGNYLINGSATPLMSAISGCTIGDGHEKTNYAITGSYCGDLFSWSDNWSGPSFPLNSNTGQITTSRVGATAKGFSVYGNRLASCQQNALMLYDREDHSLIDDVFVHYLNGRGFASGIEKNVTQAYERESTISNFKCFNCGQNNVPSFEITSQGNGSGANEMDVSNIDIYAPYGPGFALRNAGTGQIQNIKFDKVRVEGIEDNAAGQVGDLMMVGDCAMSGIAPNGIKFTNTFLLDSYPGYSALHLCSDTLAHQPFAITWDGTIGGGDPFGYGITLSNGRNNSFALNNLSTWNTGIVVGANTAVGCCNNFNGFGNETVWTWSIDATSLNSVYTPIYTAGNPLTTTLTGASNLSTVGAVVALGSPPTRTGTCTTASPTGGNRSGTFTATCTAQTVILTFSYTAPHGWICNANDNTTPADTLKQTDGGTSTTSCTLTGTTVAADRITFDATAF